MKSLTAVGIVLKAALLVSTLFLLGAHATVATEYSQHFGALRKLSVAVAEAMPAEQYVFRPDPGSMTFGELISHIASTNFAFCSGLQDEDSPKAPVPADKDKDAVVKFLSSSFEYCSTVIPPSWPGSPARHVRACSPSSRPGRSLSPRQRHQATLLRNLNLFFGCTGAACTHNSSKHQVLLSRAKVHQVGPRLRAEFGLPSQQFAGRRECRRGCRSFALPR